MPENSIGIGTGVYSTTGLINEVLLASNGCDSIISGNLQVLEAIDTAFQVEICEGSIAVVAGQILSDPGEHELVIPAQNGCDSTISATVVVLDSFVTRIDTAVCFGETFRYAGDVLDADGIYRYEYLSGGGCDSSVLVELEVYALLLGMPSLVREADGLGQRGGILQVAPNGGSGNYSVQWSNGDQSFTADSLVGGDTYCVTVTDEIGCTYDTCMLMSFPILIDSDIQSDSVKCKGESNGGFTFSAYGGEAPYNYTWRGLLSGVTGSGSILSEGGIAQINNIPEDEYEIVIADKWGEKRFNVRVEAPLLLSLNLMQSIDPQCFQDCSGSLQVAIGGGTPPYQVPQGLVTGTTWIIDGLCAADQEELKILDANGCRTNLLYSLKEPVELVAEWNIEQEVRCFGEANGLASIATNAVSPYFLWSNGDTNNPSSTLEGGPFSVTVTDQDGCTIDVQGFMPAPEAPLVASVIQTTEVDCKGDSTAALRVVNENLSYLWSNGRQTQNIEGLSAGIYTVTITDENGCEDVSNYTVSEPFALSFDWTTEAVNCWDGPNSGWAQVGNTFGGTPPYLFAVDGNPLQAEPKLSGLGAGVHTLMMEDSRGCQLAETIEIGAPPEILVSLGDDREVQLGSVTSLSANTLPSSGLSFTWSHLDTTVLCVDCPNLAVSPIETSIWEVVVQDTTTGCVASDDIRLDVYKTRAVFLPNVFSPNGDGINDFYQVFPSIEVNEVLQVVIYDRWGAEIFKQTGIANGAKRSGLEWYGWG